MKNIKICALSLALPLKCILFLGFNSSTYNMKSSFQYVYNSSYNYSKGDKTD